MRHRNRPLRAVGALLVLLLGVGGLTASTPAPDTYVALGDSYVAGPLIPDTAFADIGCLRSSRNYAKRLRPQIPVSRIKDVSCTGAWTGHMDVAQPVWFGSPNPAQLNAVDSRTKVVTLGIGGNDVGFSEILADCLRIHVSQDPCRDSYAPANGADQISGRIADLADDIDAVLAGIESRAPQAEVFVVGYPSIFPDDIADACFNDEPYLPADQEWFAAKTRELNALLEARAVVAGVHYVDVYTASQPHNVCTWGRWVEGMAPRTDALIMHPNRKGMDEIAGLVAAEVNAVVS